MMGWILSTGVAAISGAVGCGGAAGSASSGTSSASTGQSGASATIAAVDDSSSDRCTTLASFPAVPASCVPPGDSLDQALAALGTTRCGLTFAPADLALSIFDPIRQRGGTDYLALHAQPLALPTYGAAWKTKLGAAATSPAPLAQTIALAAARRGDAVDVCAPTWTAPGSDAAPLVTALVAIGASSSDAHVAAGVSLDLQRALAGVVRAAGEAAAEVNAVRPTDPTAREQLAGLATWMVGVRHFDLTTAFVAQLEAVDVARIEAAAVRLSTAIEAANLASFAGREVASVSVATPLGSVLVRGAGNDTYGAEADHALLVVDTGGNDRYLAALAASSVDAPVSVSLDLGGDDTYAYAAVPVPADAVGARQPSDGTGRTDDGRSLSTTFRQGVGALGIGLLYDLGAGHDTYASLVGSQGVGALGVGAIYDGGGDDVYTAEGFAQGAAAFGVGVLLDVAGDDHAVLYTAGQGFGFAAGVGVLLDVAGDDSYLANPGDPSLGGDTLFGSDQLSGPPVSDIRGNMSFAQGCGEGHRADWPDASFPFPGGTGVLADLAGNDRYRADVWAQGIGFVAGLGLLLDGAGNDTYDALYYAQGSAAHMGVGLLADDAGDDVYDGTYPAVNAMLGMGEDFSVGVHVDGAGDDHYRPGDDAMGEGNGNSVGVAVNIGGSDSFSGLAGEATYGAAAPAEDSSRSSVPGYGVFLKVEGPSWYEAYASNDIWNDVTRSTSGTFPPLRGFGGDLPSGSVTFSAP
jgi:hypothetical protein